jgi:kynurenine formamidase
MWSYSALPDLGARVPELAVDQVATIERQGYDSFRYEMGSNTATYLETGRHMLAEGPLIDEIPLASFFRPAVVCHVPRKGPTELIHGDELAAHCPPVREGDALLIECGWGSQWTAAHFVTAGPNFHLDCLPWLLAQPFSILGVDVPVIESARSRPSGSESAGNMLIPMFKRGVLLLAPLVNLDQVTADRGELIALPLRIQGVCGTPCRAIFMEQQEI